MIFDLKSHFATIKSYFLRFALVGSSGILINEGMLALLTEWAQLRVAVAGAIAIEISIISNFLLNRFWTWKDRVASSLGLQFLRYQSVALVAGVLNYAILRFLARLGMSPLLANLFGIAAGTLCNFFLNHYWTFGEAISKG